MLNIFISCQLFHHKDIPQFIHSVLCHGALGYDQGFAIKSIAEMNILYMHFVFTYDFLRVRV